jgi:hypothetical protein
MAQDSKIIFFIKSSLELTIASFKYRIDLVYKVDQEAAGEVVNNWLRRLENPLSANLKNL